MNKQQIMELAKQAGLEDLSTVRLAYAGFNLVHFTQLVVAAEREACARICEERPMNRTTLDGRSIREIVGEKFADTIRTRK